MRDLESVRSVNRQIQQNTLRMCTCMFMICMHISKRIQSVYLHVTIIQVCVRFQVCICCSLPLNFGWRMVVWVKFIWQTVRYLQSCIQTERVKQRIMNVYMYVYDMHIYPNVFSMQPSRYYHISMCTFSSVCLLQSTTQFWVENGCLGKVHMVNRMLPIELYLNGESQVKNYKLRYNSIQVTMKFRDLDDTSNLILFKNRVIDIEQLYRLYEFLLQLLIFCQIMMLVCSKAYRTLDIDMNTLFYTRAPVGGVWGRFAKSYTRKNVEQLFESKWVQMDSQRLFGKHYLQTVLCKQIQSMFIQNPFVQSSYKEYFMEA
eukprot:TRINITY_DN2794_c1_g2_i5.p1 TRINITY_DN2794_c1_g2~~TRINITY_DN2794_c1_g2_i5.p1  ORF type:complete len:316 (+),score=-13.66 TRINITY_DN2794_c1_g2_i5:197-1144(+)